MSNASEPSGFFVQPPSVPGEQWHMVPPPVVWARLETASKSYVTVPIGLDIIERTMEHVYDGDQADSLTINGKTATAITVARESKLFDSVKIYVGTIKNKRAVVAIGAIKAVDQTTLYQIAFEGSWSYQQMTSTVQSAEIAQSWRQTMAKIGRWWSNWWSLVLVIAITLVWLAGIILGFTYDKTGLVGLIFVFPGIFVVGVSWGLYADNR